MCSLSEFLEQNYQKLGGKVERKILVQHKSGNFKDKQIKGMSEAEAKTAYIKLAQSLRTFGTTFFLVKVFFIYRSNKRGVILSYKFYDRKFSLL